MHITGIGLSISIQGSCFPLHQPAYKVTVQTHPPQDAPTTTLLKMEPSMITMTLSKADFLPKVLMPAILIITSVRKKLKMARGYKFWPDFLSSLVIDSYLNHYHVQL
jgi:hypothetical protein